MLLPLLCMISLQDFIHCQYVIYLLFAGDARFHFSCIPSLLIPTLSAFSHPAFQKYNLHYLTKFNPHMVFLVSKLETLQSILANLSSSLSTFNQLPNSFASTTEISPVTNYSSHSLLMPYTP